VLLKSFDGGNTFSEPITITPNMTRPFWDVTASNEGNQVFVAWENQTQNLSGLPKGVDVCFRASNNTGETFGNMLDLTDDSALKTLLAAQSKALTFVAPKIATSSDAKFVYIAWQASYPDSTEIYVKASTDGGQSFGKIIGLNEKTIDPVSSLIAAGSFNPFFGQILTPMGLTISSIGVAVGIITYMIFHKRRK
jgi:hypothetical protein